jgi:hypothetical protein
MALRQPIPKEKHDAPAPRRPAPAALHRAGLRGRDAAAQTGLWELKLVFEGGPAPTQTFQHCIDAATDKQMNTVGGGMRADQCS